MRRQRRDHLFDVIVDFAEVDPGLVGGDAEGGAVAQSLGVRGSGDQRLGRNRAGIEGVAAQPGLLDQHHRGAIGPSGFSHGEAAGSGPDDAEVGRKDIGQSRSLD